MSNQLCISVTLLDGRFHGRSDGGVPEWPPSPLRLFQALIAANGEVVGGGGEVDNALHWLESQPPPMIVAPLVKRGSPYRLSVPNNAMDIVGKAWSKGNYFGSGDADPRTHNTMKTVRPMLAIRSDGQYADGCTFYYLWRATTDSSPIGALDHAARRLFALGWGVDLAVANVCSMDEDEAAQLSGERWFPDALNAAHKLRIPSIGTLDSLRRRHTAFLARISKVGFTPVPPLTEFEIEAYRRADEICSLPYAIFELRNVDSSFFRYPQRKLIHIAGMVRHLAIEAMDPKKGGSPPQDIPNVAEWIDRYVAGHTRNYQGEHRQFSYLPLPSIGHPHADQAVRRVMIAAPLGDDRLLEYLALRLAGQQLKPTKRTQLEPTPTLIRVRHDKVAAYYTTPINTWASVTPIILPGHDDHKPAKTRRLIEKALAQSGIDQPCEFEWSAFSRFPKSLSAHKYDRDKRLSGYIRPDHLGTKTAVHLKLSFNDDLKVPGPLVIGAGRHCGLGLLAGIDR